ncbi:MAG TPA: FecR family protein [Nitrosomonas europaea]|mgnify:FL=1|uniref:FecR domain-containing protein n=1 Tax=Nitrosomonas europaea TaxID=915 RepID=UPI00249207A2|nr:FecR family protein [Nitrosomonas europaea]HRN82274.1 FecR family protein [Nitrosomonas europaea]HRO57090.1 FecR family protein [Nitrosomonas europaea]HRQ08799.1 FecR family protein [Nitrosomonas europaea]HUM74640.1 FecR family protein [Nitrosomonas europaea]
MNTRLKDTSEHSPIDPRILDEAAAWLMQLHASTVTDTERNAWEQWRLRSPQHRQAWERAEQLMNKMGGLPPALSMAALTHSRGNNRRAAIKKLALLMTALPASWATWRVTPWEAWMAEYRTMVSEQREIELADGSQVRLNTATSIDVRFNAVQRLIVLHTGEILIQTAADNAVIPRPFQVLTAEGRLHALGTRFTVRQGEERSHVAVFDGAVAIHPKSGDSGVAQVLHAGNKTVFTAEAIEVSRPADDTDIAWAQGMLLADKMHLIDFTDELSRYRQGIVRCDPVLADLRISGAFPIRDTDRTLAMLQSTYPVRVIYRTSYWVTLVPR